MIGYISTLLQLSGVDIYRRTSISRPCACCAAQDEFDRQGAAEKSCMCRATSATGTACCSTAPACGLIPVPPAAGATTWKPCAARCLCITRTTATETIPSSRRSRLPCIPGCRISVPLPSTGTVRTVRTPGIRTITCGGQRQLCAPQCDRSILRPILRTGRHRRGPRHVRGMEPGRGSAA